LSTIYPSSREGSCQIMPFLRQRFSPQHLVLAFSSSNDKILLPSLAFTFSLDYISRKHVVGSLGNGGLNMLS